MDKRKKKYLDFVLKEGKDVYGYKYKRIFRFFPRESTCHSFNDEPPKSRDEVYKVYFSWVIMDKYNNPKKESKIWYECSCDECSILDEIANRCRYLAEGKTEVTEEYDGKKHSIQLLNNEVYPGGYGTSWSIDRYNDLDDKFWYEFTLFRWDDIGYRFYLPEDKMDKFGKYLDFVCDYMVEHGAPI